MIKVEHLSKKFLNGDLFYDFVLDDISISFNNCGLVAILGTSGAGKSTFLSILGGLLSFDSGEVFIDNKPLSLFNTDELASYRSNYVGFVFQSYNLLNDLTVFENVKLGCDFSSDVEDEAIYEILDELGLSSYVNKYPNCLSGGERQRVAIARAIVKKPKIIFCDEPTGALDFSTGKKIMSILKKLSLNCLVIMVTHDKKLAFKYADRIVKLSDGKIISDSYDDSCSLTQAKYEVISKTISFKRLLKLAWVFIKGKKKRNVLLVLSLVISIISLIVIQTFSSGFNNEIAKLKRNMAKVYPIVVEEYVSDFNDNTVDINDDNTIRKSSLQGMHHNKMSHDFDLYIKDIDNLELDAFSYKNPYNMPVFFKNNSGLVGVNLDDYLYTVPYNNQNSKLLEQYDLVAGRNIEKYNEILLVVSRDYTFDDFFSTDLQLNLDSYKYEDILKLSYKMLFYNDYYRFNDGIFKETENLSYAYGEGIDLKVVGIVRPKEDYVFNSSSVFLCTNDLLDAFVNFNKDSELVKMQKKKDYNVLTGNRVSEYDKSKILSSFTYNSFPLKYYLYPNDFLSKNKVLKYLNAYDKEKIVVVDSVNLVTDFSTFLVKTISFVLLFFSILSFLVVIIMVGLVFNLSIIERKKEILILKSLGARNKDIKFIFYFEAILIGIIAGFIGVIFSYLLFFPLNAIIKVIIDLEKVLRISFVNLVIFVLLSVLFTLIGSYMPINKLIVNTNEENY